MTCVSASSRNPNNRWAASQRDCDPPAHREIKRHRFTALHRSLIERRNRIDDRQRFVELLHLDVELSDLQLQVEVLRASAAASANVAAADSRSSFQTSI